MFIYLFFEILGLGCMVLEIIFKTNHTCFKLGDDALPLLGYFREASHLTLSLV